MGNYYLDDDAWHYPNLEFFEIFPWLLLTKRHHLSSFFDLCIAHEKFSLRLLWCGVCDLRALL